jgi:hypothetical protein
MSAMSRWDAQLIQMETVLVELTKEAANVPDPVTSNHTIHDRDEIDISLAKLAVDSNKILSAAKRAESQSRANSSLAWWSKQLTSKIKTLATEYVALQNRKMWLRLLQARFAGSTKAESLDLQAKHLVDLAIRRKQLDELERGLREELDAVARDRQFLKNEHEAIGVADQNWDASGSFQSRLGTNLEHSRENPCAKAFADGLSLLAVPIAHPEEDSWLRKVNADLKKKSLILAEQCRELASAVAMGPENANKLSKTHFKHTIEQVSALNDQVVRRFAALRSRPIPKSKPKVVQNHQKTDKTLAHP